MTERRFNRGEQVQTPWGDGVVTSLWHDQLGWSYRVYLEHLDKLPRSINMHESELTLIPVVDQLGDLAR